MKQILMLILLFVCTSGKAQFVSSNDTLRDWQLKIKNKPQKSVVDYYLLLPDAFFDCELGMEFNKSQRLEAIVIKDVVNGYVAFKGAYVFTIALFKDRVNDLDYVAISSNDSGRGNTCGGINAVMQFTPNGRWDYRHDVLPSKKQIDQKVRKYYKDPDDVSFHYNLPRHGLIISLNDDSSNEIICKMKWNINKFELIE